MESEGERLAAVESVLRELRDDERHLASEVRRLRDRLHKLEGSTALLLSRDEARAERSAERNRAMDRRVQILIALAAVGAIFVPLLTHFVSGG